jgi:acetyltransferase-like isoleucine patch superfamily enzyme
MLVAPLSIGDNVVIGAGSVVTKDLAANTKFVQPRRG